LSSKEAATYSCNIIRAGTAENVIPESCKFTVDIRYNLLKDLDNIKNKFMEIVNKSFIGGTTAVITKETLRPPMEKQTETLKLFDKLNKLSIENGFGELTPI
jgi:acetylornithine deacetylase/succinyl-diaminopimelate desuccinylase-like protein